MVEPRYVRKCSRILVETIELGYSNSYLTLLAIGCSVQSIVVAI